MAEKTGNLILELVPAPGTGSFTLGTPAPNRLPWSFGEGIYWTSGAQLYYFADDTAQQEWGYGTYTSGRLTRDQVLWNSNSSNARLNFGTKPVYLYPEIPAERMVYRDPASGRLIAAYDITSPTQNQGPLAGHRNRLINAGFQINQRNYAGAATAAGLYMHDRWKAGAGGCTYSTNPLFPGSTITITAGTLQQVINAVQMDGGTYTLSWTGTATARVDASAYSASPLTVTGLAAGVTHTVEFNTGTVRYPQFEPGDVATKWEIRHDEQALCDLYYSSGNFNYQGWNGGSNPMVFTISLPQKMRANPTLTLNVTTITNLSGPTLTALNSRDLALAVFGVAANPFTLFGSYTASNEL